MDKKAQAFMVFISIVGYVIAIAIILTQLYGGMVIDTGAADVRALQASGDVDMLLLNDELLQRNKVYTAIQELAEQDKEYGAGKPIDFDIVGAIKAKFTDTQTEDFEVEVKPLSVEIIKKSTKEERYEVSHRGNVFELAYYPSQHIFMNIDLTFFIQAKEHLEAASQCLDEDCLTTEFDKLGYAECKNDHPAEVYCFRSTTEFIQVQDGKVTEKPLDFVFSYELQPTQPTP